MCLLTCMFSAKVEQDNTLPSCFCSHFVNKCPSRSLCSATFFTFFGLVGDCAVSNDPEPSTEVLFGVPKHREAARYLREKISVFEKLHSGMSYSAVGREFNVNGSTTYSKLDVLKQTHMQKTRLCIDELI